MVYRNRYQCKLAFRYARRAYVRIPLLVIVRTFAKDDDCIGPELSSLLSEYEVSNRYVVVEGIRQAGIWRISRQRLNFYSVWEK